LKEGLPKDSKKTEDATAKDKNQRARRKTGRQGCPNSKQQPRYARPFGHMAAFHYGVAASHVSPVMSLRSVRASVGRRDSMAATS